MEIRKTVHITIEVEELKQIIIEYIEEKESVNVEIDDVQFVLTRSESGTHLSSSQCVGH